jgi:AcrR family transcriptional regulator
MGLSKQDIARAGLRLLNEVGLNCLTARSIAEELGVKAPALYWHMKNKQEMLDEMATQMYRDAPPEPATRDWETFLIERSWALRRMMLGYRDGAKVFAGTFVTDERLPSETPLTLMTEAGFDRRPARRALFTVHSFVIGFTIEEQAVYPVPGRRDERYDATFEDMDGQFTDGLTIVLTGIKAWTQLADTRSQTADTRP